MRLSSRFSLLTIVTLLGLSYVTENASAFPSFTTRTTRFLRAGAQLINGYHPQNFSLNMFAVDTGDKWWNPNWYEPSLQLVIRKNNGEEFQSHYLGDWTNDYILNVKKSAVYRGLYFQAGYIYEKAGSPRQGTYQMVARLCLNFGANVQLFCKDRPLSLFFLTLEHDGANRYTIENSETGEWAQIEITPMQGD